MLQPWGTDFKSPTYKIVGLETSISFWPTFNGKHFIFGIWYSGEDIVNEHRTRDFWEKPV